MDASMECVVLVLLEMGLSFSGIVCNLLVVATLRNEERLQVSFINPFITYTDVSHSSRD